MKNKTPPASYWKDNIYYILDQLQLPEQINHISCNSTGDIIKAIVNMNLRGAPLIGAAASAGTALFFLDNDPWEHSFYEMKESLLNTRPTAVNLRNVLDEASAIFENNSGKEKKELFYIFRKFSEQVHKRDIERNFIMGEKGAEYISNLLGNRKLNVLTHCNAGALATCGYGTALGVVRSLYKKKMIKNVWVDETRPYFQGSRITAFEMVSENIPHRIITDSTAAWLMNQSMVDVVITGADRVACNGDLANKIGTYSLAVNARYHNIPFMSVMPLETFDMTMENGSHIIIEERSDRELLEIDGKRLAPVMSGGLHLGFDVVPAELVTAIVTEKGIIKSPFSSKNIRDMFNE